MKTEQPVMAAAMRSVMSSCCSRTRYPLIACASVPSGEKISGNVAGPVGCS